MRGVGAALLEHLHMATRLSRLRPDDPRTLLTTPPDVGASRTLLRQRRREILADTAARLLAGEDPDSQVMPMLYRTLAAERIIDASLGFIVTELDEAMTLGFIKGFPEEMVQRCLRLDFGQAICGLVAETRTPMHVTDIQRTLYAPRRPRPLGRNHRLCLRTARRR